MKFSPTPGHKSYDVVIIGGAMMGSATAWFLAVYYGFVGRILVLEPDPTYASCSTAHTNSCIRQQFSTRLNVKISQFTANFLRELSLQAQSDPTVPNVPIRNFGYLYLAGTPDVAAQLRTSAALQRGWGSETEILTPDQIASRYPFYTVEDLELASLNRRDEGYWDGAGVFEYFRQGAAAAGVEYCAAKAVKFDCQRHKVSAVYTEDGTRLVPGQLVNCAGPRAAGIAAMAGIALPVEPRKRFTWIFKAEQPLEQDLPLTIDPSGVHVRENGGGSYLAGAAPSEDHAVDPTDFSMPQAFWMEHVWPRLASRIPRFESIRVTAEWAGHYAFNTLDQNAVLGPHPDMPNFLFQNGFSGHGLQQAPAMGRAIAEWISYGAYKTLDMTPLSYERILHNRPLREAAVI